MGDFSMQDRLILWTVKFSQIEDLAVRGFALHLCLLFTGETQEIAISLRKVATDLDLSRSTVKKYLTMLDESGEWSVNFRHGKGVDVSPAYVTVAS